MQFKPDVLQSSMAASRCGSATGIDAHHAGHVVRLVSIQQRH
jgi:hypothetical protein